MIQPLRRAHYRIWLLLPLCLAVLIAASLSARRDTTPANASFRWEPVR